MQRSMTLAMAGLMMLCAGPMTLAVADGSDAPASVLDKLTPKPLNQRVAVCIGHELEAENRSLRAGGISDVRISRQFRLFGCMSINSA